MIDLEVVHSLFFRRIMKIAVFIVRLLLLLLQNVHITLTSTMLYELNNRVSYAGWTSFDILCAIQCEFWQKHGMRGACVIKEISLLQHCLYMLQMEKYICQSKSGYSLCHCDCYFIDYDVMLVV